MTHTPDFHSAPPSFFPRTVSLLILALLCGPAACGDRDKPVRDDIALAEDALHRRDIDDAKMYFERYLRKNPDSPRRWQVWQQLLAISLDLRQDRATARGYLEIMLREFEHDPEKRRSIQLPLARICRETYDFERAALLWEALAKDPGTPDAVKAGVYIDLAKIYLRRLEFTPATDILTMCMRLKVNIARKADCLYALGEAQIFTENLEEAEAALRAAIALEGVPENRRDMSVFLLADILEQRGRRAEAIALFESIRGTYPNEKVLEMRLSRLRTMKPRGTP
ncbi:MAG: tetratricopeptide repeat protein [Desulfovibrio sp.]|jgi:tetratricopeptide (TPR) repeat protein|nr:tetratricopeptide repeat protein [Desulfovibrio sp.]